ncbi:DnaJ domain-containing protein [Microvirga yunnanensis]|uniref:DnaJ domain-containing protein n=1 Tax=Microvirga yunnanensis TaxID=2953740 RepID=UPI0021C9EAC3|nr:DnaJ domain-containing protein [Microvirga sp. HBU65207]
MTLLYGIAAVTIFWWFVTNVSQANTAALAKVLKVTGGILALGIAALLGLRGRIDIAFLLGGLGLWLLGWSNFRIPGCGGTSRRTPGSISRVRSALIEMELDHDTGGMDGTALAGAFAGQRLASLDETSLLHLLSECRASDPDGSRLLEAYLDRRFPLWRDDIRKEQARTGEPTRSGAMTEGEAYQILGLRPGASPDAIRQAHRSLMKKLHPDQGGSTYLAARVNQAKEYLLDQHC